MNRPFLRWAGGKRWLVNSAIDFVPDEYDRYIEPFLGGGAVFFSQEPQKFIISDANSDLINCYKTLRDDAKKFKSALKTHNSKHSTEYYYKVRSSAPRLPHTQAARFLYLNRACFNGLYRVNSRGDFNVPIGTSKNIILDTDDFSGVATVLSGGEILNQDFETTLDKATAGDFVFIDPPYTVKHNLNGFVQYNEKIFSWDDQIRLRDAAVRAGARGAKITITNADHESIHELYNQTGEIDSVSRASLIAGKVSNRGKTSEVIIRIGWAKPFSPYLLGRIEEENAIH